MQQKFQKIFLFQVNCICIGIINLSLLRTGYFSWAPNKLTWSRKILHVNKRDFFQLNWLDSDQSKLSRCCDADFDSAWARIPCCLLKGPPKRDFLEIYLTRFSESLISEIQQLWGSSFFPKCSKFNLDIKNAPKKLKKVFFFYNICIWIGIFKLSLIRTGYLSSAANVLKAVPRFGVSIRETFSNSIDLAVIPEYDISAVMVISAVLGLINHVPCQNVLWSRTL